MRWEPQRKNLDDYNHGCRKGDVLRASESFRVEGKRLAEHGPGKVHWAWKCQAENLLLNSVGRRQATGGFCTGLQTKIPLLRTELELHHKFWKKHPRSFSKVSDLPNGGSAWPSVQFPKTRLSASQGWEPGFLWLFHGLGPAQCLALGRHSLKDGRKEENSPILYHRLRMSAFKFT